jgi:glycosyltransferase involved in cell wall biosynthesis
MRQIATRLVERGHQVTVATTYLPERESTEIEGVKIAGFRAWGNQVNGLGGDVAAYRRYVLESDYDLFMVKSAQQWTFDALAPVLDNMVARPKIFIPCGLSGLHEPRFADYYRRMPSLLRKFDRLIFYASDYQDINFARDHGLRNLTVLPNGADEREFLVPRDPGFRQRHEIPDNAFVVLTVGSLTGLKGHRELLKAFAFARVPTDRPAVLILNGNTPSWLPTHASVFQLPRNVRHLYKSGGFRGVASWLLKPALARAGLGHVFGMLGYKVERPLRDLVARVNRLAPAKRAMLVDLPRAEVVQAYLNSDLFVLASNLEYSPLVLFEAAAAGLPFLAVPVGNAEEIARWTGAGEICPAQRDAMGYTRPDPLVLARHIESLAARPADRKSYGEAGRRNWREQFTWQKIAERYEDEFARLIDEKAALS